MRMFALISAIVAATALVAYARPQDKVNPPLKEQPEEPAKKIKELQKERIAVLEKLVDYVIARYKNAQGTYEEVLEAQMTLLKAQLDAAEKESDRIALYKQTIEALKKSEDVANAELRVGKRSTMDVLVIKARRLEAEILLEQAKIRLAKESK